MISVFRTVTFPGKKIVETVLPGEWYIGGPCDGFLAVRGDSEDKNYDRVLILSNYSICGFETLNAGSA